jgi:hypothetical protein
MIGGLLIIVGVQLILAALAFDIANVPSQAVHPTLLALQERHPQLSSGAMAASASGLDRPRRVINSDSDPT